MDEEDRESSVSLPSTKASSEVSLVDQLWFILDPRVSCVLLAYLSPAAAAAALNSCCLDHREQFAVALAWLALSILGDFWIFCRSLP